MEGLAGLDLYGRCLVIMTAAFVVACAAISYRALRPSPLERKITKRLDLGDDTPAA